MKFLAGHLRQFSCDKADADEPLGTTLDIARWTLVLFLADNLCESGLLSTTCNFDGFVVTVDEGCRASQYSFLDWTTAFMNGDASMTDRSAVTDSECLVNDIDGAFSFTVPFDKCGIVIPSAPGSAGSDGISWYEYTVYLNFDHEISGGNGNGFIQQTSQTVFQCKIPANLQENGAGIVMGCENYLLLLEHVSKS